MTPDAPLIPTMMRSTSATRPRSLKVAPPMPAQCGLAVGPAHIGCRGAPAKPSSKLLNPWCGGLVAAGLDLDDRLFQNPDDRVIPFCPFVPAYAEADENGGDQGGIQLVVETFGQRIENDPPGHFKAAGR